MTHTCQGLCSNGSVKYPLLRTLNTALSKKEKGEEPEPEEEVGQQYPLTLSTLTLYQTYPLQTCDPENYANPVSVSTTPYTGDGAGVGLAESGDSHPTPATPLSPGASSVCVKPNEPNPDLTDCSQVTQRLRKICFTKSCSVEDLPIFCKFTSFDNKG